MIVTATEFKMNLGKYLDLAMVQDIFVTKNGKRIARITSPEVNKLDLLDELIGVIPITDDTVKSIREERLARQ